jgi:hypothetical protein
MVADVAVPLARRDPLALATCHTTAPLPRITVGELRITDVAVVALYLVGRAIAEFFAASCSEPASYHNVWGGPSLSGAFAVHSGPGIAIVIAAIVWLVQRQHHCAVCPA